MTYSQAVVQLCPDAHRVIANAIAEALGHGPDNLGVPLQSVADGSLWWGCHAYWIPEVLEAQLTTDLSVVPELAEVPGAAEALAAVITERLGTEYAPTSWEECLAKHGLELVVEPEVAE